MTKAYSICELPSSGVLKAKGLIHSADGLSPIQARKPKLQNTRRPELG